MQTVIVTTKLFNNLISIYNPAQLSFGDELILALFQVNPDTGGLPTVVSARVEGRVQVGMEYGWTWP